MCYLLVKEKGQSVSREWLENAYESGNQDGFGLAYVKGGKFVVKKGLDFNRFLGDVESIPLGVNAIIHLRMASTGKVCAENCHPFTFGDLCGAHNGVISGYGSDSITDTEHFFSEAIATSHSLKTGKVELEKAIGGGKMAFLDMTGEVHYLNKEKGITEPGFWHSNTYYQPNRYAWGSYDGPEWMDVCRGEPDRLLALIESMESQADCVPETLRRRFDALVRELEAEYYYQNI